MRKLLRHGRNSKSSSGVGGGGSNSPNTIYFTTFANGIREYAESERILLNYIVDAEHNSKMFTGEITLNYVNGDPIDFVFYGDFESGTTIDISIEGTDIQNISKIDGHPVSEYSNNWTLITTSSTEWKDEDGVSFTPKAYAILNAIHTMEITSVGNGFMFIMGYIGDIWFGIDVYLNCK